MDAIPDTLIPFPPSLFLTHGGETRIIHIRVPDSNEIDSTKGGTVDPLMSQSIWPRLGHKAKVTVYFNGDLFVKPGFSLRVITQPAWACAVLKLDHQTEIWEHPG